MTDLRTRGAATGAGGRSRPRAALPALCAARITGWGIVYYAFPVLNPQITADSGWSTGATTTAFSCASAASGLAGIRIGRIVDRRGPRTVMTAGSAAGVLSLVTVALAPSSAPLPTVVVWCLLEEVDQGERPVRHREVEGAGDH